MQNPQIVKRIHKLWLQSSDSFLCGLCHLSCYWCLNTHTLLSGAKDRHSQLKPISTSGWQLGALNTSNESYLTTFPSSHKLWPLIPSRLNRTQDEALRGTSQREPELTFKQLLTLKQFQAFFSSLSWEATKNSLQVWLSQKRTDFKQLFSALLPEFSWRYYWLPPSQVQTNPKTKRKKAGWTKRFIK